MAEGRNGNGNGFVRVLLQVIVPLVVGAVMSAAGGYFAVSSKVAVLEERITNVRAEIARDRADASDKIGAVAVRVQKLEDRR